MDSSRFSFRPATRADLPVILELYAHLGYPGETPLDAPAAQAIWERISATPGYTIWLVEESGRAIATYTLVILANLGHRGRPSSVVENVVVEPDRRGGGLGKAMMAHAAERCREAGCYKLALSSNRKRTEAHRFYESLGFERHGYSFVIDP